MAAETKGPSLSDTETTAQLNATYKNIQKVWVAIKAEPKSSLTTSINDKLLVAIGFFKDAVMAKVAECKITATQLEQLKAEHADKDANQATSLRESADEISRLQAQISALTAEASRREALLAEKTQAAAGLTTEIREANDQINQLDAKLAKASEQSTLCEQNLAASAEARSILETANAELVQSNSNLEAEIARIESATKEAAEKLNSDLGDIEDADFAKGEEGGGTRRRVKKKQRHRSVKHRFFSEKKTNL